MISLTHVSKKFGSVQAVDDLTLEIKSGEIFGFLGPNGAGKSTTLKMITGIVPPDSGSILIDGRSIATEALEAKRNFGFVPDSPDMFLKLKGSDYLEFMASVYHVDPELSIKRTEELAQKFEMTSALGDFIGNYSHGMRQKIIIMGALIHDPSNWILDEPMTGLDPQSSFLLKTLMREKADQGNSVLFSTHVLEVAEKLCDRVGIIAKGKLLFVGTLDELKDRCGEDKSLETLFLEITK